MTDVDGDLDGDLDGDVDSDVDGDEDGDATLDAETPDDGGDAGLDPADQRAAVRERYAGIASGADTTQTAESKDAADTTEAAEPEAGSGGCCGGTGAGCGDEGPVDEGSVDEGSVDADATASDGGTAASTADSKASAMGYSQDELDAVASGANLGLGCGNPTAIASLDPGDTVLDLGSGGGFDCFLAAEAVGPSGRVIGVDMTPEMIERARANVDANDADVVEFRLGEIEHLPVADATVDVVISNCVVNLSPDKPQVFREAHRVLAPGGRLAISDVVLTADLPVDLAADPDSVAGCVAGAARIGELETMLDDAGFTAISIEPKSESESFIRDWDPDRDLSDYIVSATIEAEKPTSD